MSELSLLECECDFGDPAAWCIHRSAKDVATRSSDLIEGQLALAFLWSERERGAVYSMALRKLRQRFVGPGVGTFRLILADPPWPERGGGKVRRGCNRHYPTMKVSEIIALPVEYLCSLDGAHLWLWATNNHLEDAFAVMRAWGFRYVTMRTWFKGEADEDEWEEIAPDDVRLQNAGLGQYVRGQTEHLLFGVRGRLPYKLKPDGKRAQVGSAIIALRTEKHSEKPPQIHEECLLVSHAPAAELFGRERRPGYVVFGNQVESDLLLISNEPKREQLALF